MERDWPIIIYRTYSLGYTKMNYMLNGYEDEKISIYMALQLYLDFLNIFLYILQLLGRRDD